MPLDDDQRGFQDQTTIGKKAVTTIDSRLLHQDPTRTQRTALVRGWDLSGKQ